MRVPADGGVHSNNGRKREMMDVVMKEGKKWCGVEINGTHPKIMSLYYVLLLYI